MVKRRVAAPQFDRRAPGGLAESIRLANQATGGVYPNLIDQFRVT
jgi:hypothetical protein